MTPRVSNLSTACFLKCLVVAALLFGPKVVAAQSSTPVDFGSLGVGTSATQVLSFSFTGLSQPPVFSLHYNLDFMASPAVCSADGNTCTLSVTFSPKYPGVRRDSVLVKDAGGTVLARKGLYGTGLGPVVFYLPADVVRYSSTFDYTYRIYGGVASDTAGSYYISLTSGHQILKTNGTNFSQPTAYAGNFNVRGYAGDGGPALAARFNSPTGLALDGGGSLYIADRGNHVIRRIDGDTQIVTTIAGNGAAGYTGDGGLATSATLSSPTALAIDVAGNIFIADSTANVIRRVDGVTRQITTVAGIGIAGYSGDNGLAVSARLSAPTSLALDAGGNLFVADSGNYVVRKIFMSDGLIKTIAGTGRVGTAYTEDIAPLQADLSPLSVAVDASGSLIIGERFETIKRVSVDGTRISKLNGFLYLSDQASAVDISATGAIIACSQLGIVVIGGNQSKNLSAGVTPVGSSSALPALTLQNTGTADLDLSIAFSGPNATDYSQTNNCGATLTVGTACPLSLTFTPTSEGSRTAELSISTDPRWDNSKINLASTARSGLVISPSTVSFGAINLGKSASATLSIQNPGDLPVTLDSMAFVAYPDYAAFTQTNNCGRTVEAHSNCQMIVTFAPLKSGNATADLTWAYTSPQYPYVYLRAQFSGIGQEVPSLKIETKEVYFSQTTIGALGSYQFFALTNNTGSAVSLPDPVIGGRDAYEFSSFNNCGLSLTAGASCRIYVVFNATRLGVQTANISVLDGYSGSYILSLTGTGILPTQFEVVNGLTAKALSVIDAFDGSAVQQIQLSGSAQQIWRATLISNNYYRIENTATGKVLDVTGASIANGTPIQQYAWLGTDNQQWQFVTVDEAHFRILNRATGKVLDLPGGSKEDRTPIQQWEFNGSKQQLWSIIPTTTYRVLTSNGKPLSISGNAVASGARVEQSKYLGIATQQWQLIPVESGYFAIFNHGSGKVLDVIAGSTENGAAVQQYDFHGGRNQQWRVNQFDISGQVRIVNRASGKVLDLTGGYALDATPIQQWQSLGTTNQSWTLSSISYFQIQNIQSRKALDIPSGSDVDGTPVQQWTPNNLPQQAWELVYNGTTYAIINRASGKALEVAGGSTVNGAPIQQSTYTGTDAQLWQFVRATVFNSFYYLIVNKQSGKVLDVTGYSSENGTRIQQYQSTNASNQFWQLSASY